MAETDQVEHYLGTNLYMTVSATEIEFRLGGGEECIVVEGEIFQKMLAVLVGEGWTFPSSTELFEALPIVSTRSLATDVASKSEEAVRDALPPEECPF